MKKGTYYNNSVSNEIMSKCYAFGCRMLDLDTIDSTLMGLSYVIENEWTVEICCSDGNLEYYSKKRRRYMAAELIRAAMPYREKTKEDVYNFLESI